MSSLATQSTPLRPISVQRNPPPKSVLANVMIHTDFTGCNEIRLNRRSFNQLFPFEEYTTQNPLYISLGQKIWMVNQLDSNEEGNWASFNSYDYDSARLENHVTIFNSTKKLTIAVYKPDLATAVQLKSIRFTIAAFTNSSGFSSDCVVPAANIDVTRLKEQLHGLLDNHFLKIGQILHIECEGVHCRLTVIDNLVDLEGSTCPSHNNAKVTEETEIEIQMENKGNINRILLVSQVPAEKVKYLHLEIESDEKSWYTPYTKDEPWYGQEDFLPIALPLALVKSEIIDKYSAIGIVSGIPLTLYYGSWSYTIKLKHVGLHDPTTNKDLLSKRYGIPSTDALELTPIENVRLLKDNVEPVTGTLVKFRVLRAEPRKSDNEKYPYINVNQLKAAILERAERHKMFNGAKFNVHLTTGTYHLELVTCSDADSTSDVGTLSNTWRLSEETKFEFTIVRGLAEKLIDNDKAHPLTQFVLRTKLKEEASKEAMKTAGTQLSETVYIKESDLVDLVNAKLPSHLFKDQQFVVEHELGYKISFTVKELTTEDKPTESAYVRITERTPQTKIKFDIPSGNKLSLLSKKHPLTYKNVDEKLSTMKLGGMKGEMEQIARAVITSYGPGKKMQAALGLDPIKGILLYGPPGNGKTTFARQIGELLGCDNDRFKSVSGSDLLNMYVGETERNMRELIAPAEAAYAEYGEESELYIVFLDEIDSIAPSRNNSEKHHTKTMVNQLLTLMDGPNVLHNVLFIATTNRRDLMDTALLRPGRFDLQVEVKQADEKGREEIFEIHLKSAVTHNLLGSDVNLARLAIETSSFSGADIKGLVRLASTYYMERVLKRRQHEDEIDIANETDKIGMQDFRNAFQELKKLTKAPSDQ